MSYYLFANEKTIMTDGVGPDNPVLRMQYDRAARTNMWIIVTQTSAQQASREIGKIIEGFVSVLDNELSCEGIAYFSSGDFDEVTTKNYGAGALLARQKAYFHVYCDVMNFMDWLNDYTANGSETIITHVVMPPETLDGSVVIVPMEDIYPGARK